MALLEASRECRNQAAVSSRRRRRRDRGTSLQARADRAQTLIQMGELSAARHALEGDPVAPGSDATLNALEDPERRPRQPREPLADDLSEQRGPAFSLDPDLFAKNVRNARRGAAGGPSGMTADHLRMILESEADTAKFWRLAQDLARAAIPEKILDVIRLERLTALAKPSGGHPNIVCGDIVRRLVARTMAQQLAPAVERATSPFQYAFTTRAGGECIAHAFQAFTDLDDRTTVLSIDGIGAFDLISREAMLNGLRSMDGGNGALLFVLQFYGNPSSYLWDHDDGTTHEILQFEGGEQGDPLMPILYSLGQHHALCAVQSKLRLDERLFAFLDDIYVVCSLWRHSRIQIHAGKTQIWNSGGHVPDGVDDIFRIAQVADPDAPVWFGDHALPLVERGIRVLGTPLGIGRMSRPNCDQRQHPTESCLSAFLRFTCSLRGCCFSSVPVLVRTTS